MRTDVVRPEERELICRLRAGGLTRSEVIAVSGRSRATVDRVIVEAGGLPPRRTGRAERALRLEEREEISRGLKAGESFRTIARGLGRSPSTISREVVNNGGPEGYRAWAAEGRAYEQAARPKPAKLVEYPALGELVEAWLEQCWSPQQIANRLRLEFPDEPEMWVSHETIYQSLYVQTRGALRKDLTAYLRTKRSKRQPQGSSTSERRGKIPDMVNISERPPEVEDRAVPGHWEGDLIIGKNSGSAIGTLVERTTRYVMLLHLPDGHGTEAVLAAMTAKIKTLPDGLFQTVTWDQGKELAGHAAFTLANDVQVFFCDPHSPWQRGTNENTNGLLRQYFPKGTDLSVHDEAHLDAVAAELNGRPRETLAWMKPCERLAELVAAAA
jgi:transposase, IS30 family